ncbi:MAG: MlaD family protein, partial [Planctomycetota bacterium]
MTKEFLIGFVFLIAAAIVAFVTATVQNFNPFKDEFVVYVDYNRVNDLSKDNDVTFNGLRIGFVKSIEFRNVGNERKIRVTLSLEQVDLPVNAVISIQDRTILGGKKINITRPDESGPRAEPGHVFTGQDPDPLLKEAGTTLKKIGESFDELKTLLTDIKEGQGTLGKLFTDPELFNEWSSAGKEFSDVGSKLNKGDGTLGKLINEPDLYNDAKSYMDRLNRLHFDFTLDWKNFPEKAYSITEGGL